MIVPGKPQPAAIPLSRDLTVSPSHVRVQGIGNSPKYRVPKPSRLLHRTAGGRGIPIAMLPPATGAESIPNVPSKADGAA